MVTAYSLIRHGGDSLQTRAVHVVGGFAASGQHVGVPCASAAISHVSTL